MHHQYSNNCNTSDNVYGDSQTDVIDFIGYTDRYWSVSVSRFVELTISLVEIKGKIYILPMIYIFIYDIVSNS